MMRVLGELLRNDRNDASVSSKIREYFTKYPKSTARECCRAIDLNYQKYGGRARKIKHDLAHWIQSVIPVTEANGQLLKSLTSVHKLELHFKEPVPVSYVAVLEEGAVAGRVDGAWYRSPNRNRQLQYFDEHISIRVYPKSGTCRILPRRRMTFDDVRVYVEDAFAKVLPTQAILSESFGEMMNGLQVARRHRTFHVGPLTPFNVKFYRHSLGLDILADGSHPEHLEVRENWPTWIPSLMELQHNNTMVVSQFSSEIRSHLHVMHGIETAVDRLNETLDHLSKIVALKETD